MGVTFEGRGMEPLRTIVPTLAGTPSRLQGIVTHGITDCHHLLITPLVLAVSYGNSSSVLIQ